MGGDHVDVECRRCSLEGLEIPESLPPYPLVHHSVSVIWSECPLHVPAWSAVGEDQEQVLLCLYLCVLCPLAKGKRSLEKEGDNSKVPYPLNRSDFRDSYSPSSADRVRWGREYRTGTCLIAFSRMRTNIILLSVLRLVVSPALFSHLSRVGRVKHGAGPGLIESFPAMGVHTLASGTHVYLPCHVCTS